MLRLVSWQLYVTAAVTFAAGVAVGQLRIAEAADSSPMTPMFIHVSSLASADLPPPPPGGAMQNKIVAVADGATVQVQLGTVGKHYHANSNEIQYVVQGQG